MSSSDPDLDPMDTPGDVSGSRSYELSGKIMLSAIVILFFVVILMVCLHVYARWYLLRARRRYLRRRNRNRRHTTVFFVDPSSTDAGARGLDPSVLKSLPVFNFSSATHPNSIECAVCLSEFEENESCRFLPNCKHSFHVECIDMWFHSHSTCPLCRSLIEPVSGEEIPADVVIRIPGEPVHRNEPGSNTNSDGAETSEPPDENWIKPVAIEVPRRTFGEFEDELTRGGSSASSSLRSPMSRMLSFKRILSRDRRTVPSPSGGAPSSCLSVNEPDMERAIEENR